MYRPRFDLDGNLTDTSYVRYFVDHHLGGGERTWFVRDGGSMGQEPFSQTFATAAEARAYARELDLGEHDAGHPRSAGIAAQCCPWCQEAST